jgi:hypothetical protein
MNTLASSGADIMIDSISGREISKLSVVSPADIGFSRGAWEMLQNPALLNVYANFYKWDVLEHQAILMSVKRVPALGILRASVYSPEAACGGDWQDRLGSLPAGHVSVMTNVVDRCGESSGQSQHGFYSFVIDLRPEPEKVFSGFKRRTRRAITKAMRAGMYVRLAETNQEIIDFYMIADRRSEYGRLYKVLPRTLYQDLDRTGHARLYVAFFKGRVVGGVMILIDHYAHGVLSAYDAQAADGLPGNLLYWGMMLGEIERGVVFLDLGAQSPSEQPELTFFKSGFSPFLVPAYGYDLRPSRWRSFGSHAWEFSKRFRAGR